MGRDFKVKRISLGLSSKLQRLDLLDRVLAGCCWEVYATRAGPQESLSSLRQVSKCLTMMFAIYLAKEVAAILRVFLTHPTKKLYDAHLSLLHGSTKVVVWAVALLSAKTK